MIIKSYIVKPNLQLVELLVTLLMKNGGWICFLGGTALKD